MRKHQRKGIRKSSRKPTPVIPPLTVVELVKADLTTPEWKNSLGERYRVGYYNAQDGLNTVWLVDEEGNYIQTTDQNHLLKYFKIVRLSKEDDYFGVDRHPLRAISRKPMGPLFGSAPRPVRKIRKIE